MIHLRYYHPAGGSKDWFAEIRPDGLVIRFGKTAARTMQERFIPATECRPDPTGEARNRANQKMKKGYMLVREQPSLAGVAPPPPVEPSHPVSEQESGVSSVLQEWGQENTQNWF
jgi:predicted DNA-binding WGR domain protein